MSETAQKVVADIDLLTQRLEAVRAANAQGEIVSLDGLDREVGRLCQAVQALPPAEMTAAADSMGRALAVMDALRDELAAKRNETTEAIGALSTRKQAVAAYGKSDVGPRRR